MRLWLLLLLGFGLVPLVVRAQTTVSGRVVDAKTRVEIPGAIVLQIGTSNGTSTNADGTFTLSLPGTPPLDSISLNFSSILYGSQQLRVASGSNLAIRLVPDKRVIDCPPIGSGPLAEVGLASGLRYAPFGGTLKVYGFRRRPRRAFRATVGYQTDFGQNHAFTAGLELPPLWRRRDDACRFYLSETLSYEELQVGAADTHFESYRAMVSIGGFSPLGNLPYRPYLIFLAGGGYAHSQPFIPTDAHSAAGFGYSLGLASGFYTRQDRRLAGTVQATQWPTFWQWQALITRTFSSNIKAGLNLNHLQRYTELAVFLNYTFY